LNVLRHSATASLLVLMTVTGRAQVAQLASGRVAQDAAQTQPVAPPKKPAAMSARPAVAPARRAAPSSPSVPAPIPINRTVIVLDPAHGGVDSGSQITDKTVEKDVTLALAFRLRSLLTARGFNVVMTRDTDAPAVPNAAGSALMLDDRAGIANHAHAAACLVLHATRSGNGVHLYRSELEASEGQPFVVPWLSAQTAWIPQSQHLESQMAAAFSRSGLTLVASSASVRPIDSLTCPALVVELAPSGDDADSINDADYQQRVALTIAGELLFWQNVVQPPARLSAATKATTVGQTTTSEAAGAQP
jgi:N-acetylmuramoyl-L-alanine amidase